MIAPWDNYMPDGNPRYYGDPCDYHYLFKLVRDNAEYFDGYDDAYVTGYDLSDSRYSSPYPITITGGSGQVSATVRAVAGDSNAPVVIHLVEYDDVSPQAFSLNIEHSRFFGDTTNHGISMIFHDDQTSTSYSVVNNGTYSTLSVPALETWAMVLVSRPGTVELVSADAERVQIR